MGSYRQRKKQALLEQGAHFPLSRRPMWGSIPGSLDEDLILRQMFD